MRKVSRSRTETGSVMGIAAGLSFTLVILGVGFFFFTMYMGAQKETKNAVDAGTLNVGRKALSDVSVKILPTNQFFDVTSDKVDNKPTNCDGDINLRRINRLWAKAMLYKINAMGAQSDGLGGNGNSNASSALSECKSLSDDLASKLKNQNNLHGFFTDVASRNSVRMIGQSASVSVISGQNWQTAHMEKEGESNVMLGGNNGSLFEPTGFSWNNSDLTKTVRQPAPQGAAGVTFFKGYQPITLGGDNYWQVPFLFDEKPHLVARSNFEPAKQAPNGWQNAVPNAFSAEGVASQPGRPAEKATSWMLTNPRQTFKASIPTGFVHIKLETPKVEYYFLPHAPGPLIHYQPGDGTYGFTPSNPSVTAPGFGVLCTTSTADPILGGDTTGRTVDELLFSTPGMSPGDKAHLEQNLVSRCNEMVSKPGVSISTGKMHDALDAFSTRGEILAGQRDFYLYSPDGEKVVCRSRVSMGVDAPWMLLFTNNTADGTEKTYKENDMVGPPSFGKATPDPFCKVVSPVAPGIPCGMLQYKLQNFWKPGTGTNHCLGDIRCQRGTDVNTITISVFTLI